MQLILIINTVVCVVGVLAGVMLASGSIISIANMQVPWAPALLGAALLVPVMFAVSAIGAWVAYSLGLSQVAIGLVALPWVYGVVFVLAMLVSFKW
ncbi:MAG: hypothetical protein RLZZ387_3604 [Chloroflexota bacterium]